MVMKVTPEEQAKFRELNRLRMKTWRDKNRKHKYSPRKKIDVPKSTEAKE